MKNLILIFYLTLRWLISIFFLFLFFMAIEISLFYSILICVSAIGLNPIVFNKIQKTFSHNKLFIFSKKFLSYIFFYIIFFIGAFNLSSIEKKKNVFYNEENISENPTSLNLEEKKIEKTSTEEEFLIDKWNSMKNGELSFYQISHPDNDIDLKQYEFLCKNSNFVNSNALSTGLVGEPFLFRKIVNNGGKIFKQDIYWLDSIDKCIVEFKVQGLIDGSYYDKLFEKIVISFMKDQYSAYITHLTSY